MERRNVVFVESTFCDFFDENNVNHEGLNPMYVWILTLTSTTLTFLFQCRLDIVLRRACNKLTYVLYVIKLTTSSDLRLDVELVTNLRTQNWVNSPKSGRSSVRTKKIRIHSPNRGIKSKRHKIWTVLLYAQIAGWKNL